jgi:ribokinase
MDIVVSIGHLPQPGETIGLGTLDHFPGGKGANQAIAAARLGSETSILGAVGNDAHAITLIDYLQSSGVSTGSISQKAECSTGQAFIWVSAAGENMIVVVPGANHAFGPDALGDLPEGASVLLSQFEMPLETIRAFFSAPAAKAGRKIINAAPALAGGKPLFALADIVILNEVELSAFSDSGLPEISDHETLIAQARTLMSRPEQIIIVTIGAAGAIAVSGSEWFHVSGREAPVVDTTGAGDCFCGALAAALDDGLELREAINFANLSASLAVGRKGAGPAMPTRAEVLERMT